MDAPPENEDSRPFVQVSAFLGDMGLNAPQVIASDLGQGFLLLSDLGTTPYLDCLQSQPDQADRLYGDAMSALLTMQNRGRTVQAQLPPYDEKLPALRAVAIQ